MLTISSGPWSMECDELSGSWRCSETFPGQRSECPGLRLDGLFLSFWRPDCKSYRSQVDSGSGRCRLSCLQCWALYQQQICMLGSYLCEVWFDAERGYREMSGLSLLVLSLVVSVLDYFGLQRELLLWDILLRPSVDNT